MNTLKSLDIPEIVVAVVPLAFPKAKVLPEGQPAALQPVTGQFQ